MKNNPRRPFRWARLAAGITAAALLTIALQFAVRVSAEPPGCYSGVGGCQVGGPGTCDGYTSYCEQDSTANCPQLPSGPGHQVSLDRCGKVVSVGGCNNNACGSFTQGTACF